jgi:hypothetical protein
MAGDCGFQIVNLRFEKTKSNPKNKGVQEKGENGQE